jgi:hypothetical protein
MKRNSDSKRLLIAVGLSLLGLAAALTWKVTHGKATLVTGPMAEPMDTESSLLGTSPTENDSVLHEAPSSEVPSAPQLPAVLQVPLRSTASAQPTQAVEPRNSATPYTIQLVSTLSNFDFAHNPVTPEQAEQWKNTLQSLTSQGAAAVPAIRDFLEQNREVTFAGVVGSELLGQSSLRSALINALGQIGGPEALGVMAQTLRTTTLPSEVGQLAQYLEQMAPGQYRQDILSSASQMLSMAGSGQLRAGWDTGDLFKVLQTYGDNSTASLLEQLQPQWKYYTVISLAGLPGGEGLPSLIRLAQNPEAASSRDFALQMLAQMAAQYPDAGAALMEGARLNQIPDRAWAKIAAGLAGEQLQIGTPPGDPSSGEQTTPGLKTFHIQNGNQNFYSLPLLANGEASQRLALLDQLISVTGNPAALAALQNARMGLSALVAK